MSRIEFKEKNVFIDSQAVQILSGAIHYFRVHPDLWRDRLEKLKMCGLNCVETYMCWNLHEPQEGEFYFDGMLDFEKFIKLAQELGLYVILRPGPYICAEWDNGGFPAWLMNKPGIEFRRMNEPYLKAVKNYFETIIPKFKHLQYDEEGPIIAFQIENEYGSYGHDKDYLHWLRNLMLDGGLSVPLFTADGASPNCILSGSLPNTPVTLTFGSRSKEAFALHNKFSPDTPFFSMEFWNGWFDAWGEDVISTRTAESVANEFEDILRVGGNINFYMFHGGTNFGFTAGANWFPQKKYTPDTTSYDYGAPLSEAGDPTDKYFAIQKLIKKYRPEIEIATPVASKKKAYGKANFTETTRLFDNLEELGEKTEAISPKTMEELGQDFGFVLYRTTLEGSYDTNLTLYQANDRAQAFLDEKPFFTAYRNDENLTSPKFHIPEAGITIDILVENFGRINYGFMTGQDFKGLRHGLQVSNTLRFNWEMWSLPMNNVQNLKFGDFDFDEKGPAFHRAEFDVDEVADTFLEFPGECGVVWINNFNLGRYWNIGPGNTLYVPAPVIKKGKNEMIVFETTKLSSHCANFVKTR